MRVIQRPEQRSVGMGVGGWDGSVGAVRVDHVEEHATHQMFVKHPTTDQSMTMRTKAREASAVLAKKGVVKSEEEGSSLPLTENGTHSFSERSTQSTSYCGAKKSEEK